LIITDRLPARTSTELANGDGAPVVVGYLHEAQHGKHLMLLHAVAEAANDTDPVSPAMAALQASSKLPAIEQISDPCNVAWLFSLSHIGGWAGDCLVRLDPGLPPEFRYLARTAATPAVQADARFGICAARGRRSIPRSINASDVRRSVGRRVHELAVLHSLSLACDGTAPQLAFRTGGGRRVSDRPAHSAKRRRLCRRDSSAVFSVFATSCPTDPVTVAAPRCGHIAMNRRQPTSGSVDRRGSGNPPPDADAMVVVTKGSEDGATDVAAWFTWHRSA
jgi:hypothetical protein